MTCLTTHHLHPNPDELNINTNKFNNIIHQQEIQLANFKEWKIKDYYLFSLSYLDVLDLNTKQMKDYNTNYKINSNSLGGTRWHDIMFRFSILEIYHVSHFVKLKVLLCTILDLTILVDNFY